MNFNIGAIVEVISDETDNAVDHMHDQCYSDLTDVLISDSQLGLSDQTWESAKFLLHTTDTAILYIKHGIVVDSAIS